jgi:hypothetical protein
VEPSTNKAVEEIAAGLRGLGLGKTCELQAASCFRPRGEGYWTEILLGMSSTNGVLRFTLRAGIAIPFSSNKNHVLAIHPED